MAARWPAASGSNSRIGSDVNCQSVCNCSSVSAVPKGAATLNSSGLGKPNYVHVTFDDDESALLTQPWAPARL